MKVHIMEREELPPPKTSEKFTGPHGQQIATRMCFRCLLLLTFVAVAQALPTASEKGLTETDGSSNTEQLSVREERSVQIPSHVTEAQAEADRKMAEDFLKKYGYFRKGKPLAMLDDQEAEAGDRQERDTKSDAIRMFQSYVGLPQSGQLDQNTIEFMKKRRCGVEDVPEDSNRDPHNPAPAAFNVMSDKWDKDRLTWKLSGPSRKGITTGDQRRIIRQAFDVWAEVAPLTFEERAPSSEVDIDMLFGARDHGDDYPFDGPSKVLAHAYGPIYSTSIKGDVHFDEDETWTADNAGHGADLLIVTTHELGHSLGLGHSRDPNALMYPFYGMTNALGQDDIRAIQYLYGARITPRPTQSPRVTPRPVTQAPVTRAPITRRPYTARPTTPTITTTTEDFRCRAHFDVVIQDEHRDRKVYTGITGRDVIRFTENGVLARSKLHDLYPGAPVGADAVFTVAEERATYFIKDSQVWKYNDFVLDSKSPRSIDPTHFPETVRFVLPFENSYGETERIFVFGSTHFWEYNFDDEVAPKPRPYLISQYWRQVRNDVSYVVTWTDNNMYFISPDSHVILTRMRSQANRGQEAGHPAWLQSVCKGVVAFSPHTGDNGAAGHSSVTSLIVAACLSLIFFLRR